MAITVTTPDNFGGIPSAPSFVHRLNVVLDSSYPSGGYELDLQTRVGEGKTIGPVWAVGKVTSSGMPDTRYYYYNRVTDKLVAMKADGSGEVAAATDLSTITVEVNVLSS
jgi:hypothetical protein